MKIISKFHDYYDTVLSTGQDLSVTYERTSSDIETVELEHVSLFNELVEAQNRWTFQPVRTFQPYKVYGKEDSVTISEERISVAFCGKVHNIVIFTCQDETTVCSTEQQVITYLKKHKQEKFLQDNRECRRLTKWVTMDTSKVNTDAIHLAFNTPIIAIRFKRKDRWHHSDYSSPDVTLTLNPCLKDLKFQSVVGPYIAFQELSMYLANQLACEQQPPVEIDDKYKLQGKGFDNVSFKTRKGSKKPRKNKNLS